MTLSHSSSMVSIQPSTLLSLLLPCVTVRHPFMISSLNYLAMKSYSRTNSITSPLKPAPLPFVPTAPITTLENQGFSPNPMVNFITPLHQVSSILHPSLQGIILHPSINFPLLGTPTPAPLRTHFSILHAIFAARPIIEPWIATIGWTSHTKVDIPHGTCNNDCPH